MRLSWVNIFRGLEKYSVSVSYNHLKPAFALLLNENTFYSVTKLKVLVIFNSSTSQLRSWTDFFFLSFVLLGPHPWHMEVPSLGVSSELLLPAYGRVTATPDLSCIGDLHHSSWQPRILNLLSEARDRTCNLLVPSWIRFHCATMGNTWTDFLPPR